jgi:hypothetical protein
VRRERPSPSVVTLHEESDKNCKTASRQTKQKCGDAHLQIAAAPRVVRAERSYGIVGGVERVQGEEADTARGRELHDT